MRAATMTVTESKASRKAAVFIGEAMPLIAAQSLRRVGIRSRSPGTLVKWLSCTTGTCAKLNDHRQGRPRAIAVENKWIAQRYGVEAAFATPVGAITVPECSMTSLRQDRAGPAIVNVFIHGVFSCGRAAALHLKNNQKKPNCGRAAALHLKNNQKKPNAGGKRPRSGRPKGRADSQTDVPKRGTTIFLFGGDNYFSCVAGS